MRIRMRTRYASPRGNVPAGGWIDLPRREAINLIDLGYAEPPGPPPRPDPRGTVPADDPEKADDGEKGDQDPAKDPETPEKPDTPKDPETSEKAPGETTEGARRRRRNPERPVIRQLQQVTVAIAEGGKCPLCQAGPYSGNGMRQHMVKKHPDAWAEVLAHR